VSRRTKKEEGKEGIADTMSSIDYQHARLEGQLQILVNGAREWELVDHQSFRVRVEVPIRMISNPGRLCGGIKYSFKSADGPTGGQIERSPISRDDE
jgi:hypothetical protein